MPSIKTNNNYYLFLIVLYFVLSLVGILHHEIWLDEGHHWLLARDSNSFIDLIHNTRYEGHPILWNILLFIISRFTSDPFWMQLLHILISTSVVVIFLKKAPFSILFKTLFIFGYFMFFEYNIISRNYMLGVLFIFLACSIFKDRNKKFILLCFYLTLAANTHLIFAVLSFAFFLTLLFENYQKKKLFLHKVFLIGYLIFLTGFVVSILQIAPPMDTTFFDHTKDLSLKEKLIPGFVSLFKGLAPIPDFRSIHFWNSNLFINLSKPIAILFSFLVYFIPLLLFYKKKRTLFFVYISLVGIHLFFFMLQMSATRYFGITFITVITALWMDENYNLRPLNKYIIYGILILQFIGGIIAYSMDIKQPFSNGRDITLFLKEKELSNYEIITPFCQGTIISSDLRKKVYFLCEDSFQSYCHWNHYASCNPSKQNILNNLSKLNLQKPKIFIAKVNLLNNPKKNTWYDINDQLSIKYLIKLDEYVVRNLDYTIYKIKNKNYNEE